MFEVAEVGRKLSKTDYKAQVPHLRSELLDGAAGAPSGVVPRHRAVCRRRHGGEGRDGQSAQRVDGSALDRDARVYAAIERGARAAAAVALLARSAAAGPPRDVSERLVFLADPRPGGAPAYGRGVRLAARSGRRLRAGADRRWRDHREVLDAPEQAGAEEAAPARSRTIRCSDGASRRTSGSTGRCSTSS